MKKYIAFITMLSLPAFALKVGVVDLEKALQSVKKGKDAKDKLEKKFKAKKVTFDKQKKDFETAQEEFKKKSLGLSEKAKNEQMLALQQKYAALQQLNQDAQVDMQQEEVKETQPIIKGLQDMIPEVSKDSGLELVFEAKAGLLYATDKTDLTDKLINLYDKKNPIK